MELGKRKPIRLRVHRIVMGIAVTATLIACAVGFVSMVAIRGISEEALLNNTKQNVGNLVESKAELAEAQFGAYQDTVQRFADYIGDLYAHPENYVKLRFLENHDRPRAAALLPDSAVRKNWTSFLFFQKGMPLLYAGQEYGIPHLPALFERDPLPALPQYSDSSVQDISAEHTFAEHDSAGDVSAKAASAEAAFVRRLCALRRSPVFTDSRYEVRAMPGDILLAEHRSQRGRLLGVFRLKGGKMPAEINLPAPDGIYRNLTDGRLAEVRQGLLSVSENPVIIQVS